MTRPRRPVLAASCAVMLLATAALWADSRLTTTRAFYGFGRVTVGAYGTGGRVQLGVGWYTPTVPPPSARASGAAYVQGWHWVRPERGPALKLGARTFSVPGGGGVSHRGLLVVVPYGGLVALFAAAFWWSWRGRKAGNGFPVEAKAEHEEAGRISN